MQNFDERYKKLNKEQRRAVDSIDGPMMVVAGPGSGKTELLSLRTANILQKTDIYASSILCLTFTESACNNMRERLHGLIGVDAYRVSIYTFHSFGVDVIRNHSEFFYKGAEFSATDEITQIEILRDIFSEMDFDNPLGKKHPEQGYTYLKDTRRAIADLKKAGLRPDEFRKIIAHNKEALAFVREMVHELMSERLSKKMFASMEKLINHFRDFDNADFPVSHMKPLLPAIADSLEKALQEAQATGKTAPLSAWKVKNIKINDEKKKVLKEEKYLEHMFSLANVYEAYREEMYRRGFMDYDDMLLDAIFAIENNESLRYELQENFLYIMVDEFQDTNDAQARLFQLLCDYDNIDQSPNIMVVGDDDQAVFKFQGARVSNVLEFKNKYKDTQFITLKNNYRSSQNILDLARHVIGQGEERLENMVEEIEKELIASNPEIKKGDIVKQSFETRDHEYRYIAREIKKLLSEGMEADEIAIIARQHENLEGIVPFLQYENIPIKYERQQNILLEPHIYQIIQIARFVVSLLDNKQSEADDLLPEILSYPFWNLERREIWNISIGVRKQRANARREQKNKQNEGVNWLSYMLESNNERLQKIAEFFLELKKISYNEPLEYIFDKIIGVSSQETMEEEGFRSPFRDYYFNEERFQKARAEYLKFLSSLNAFRNALREYKRGQMLRIRDMIEFEELHKAEGIIISDKSPFISAEKAVELLTAHKAKGLEFETVFVINCQNNIWAGRNKSNNLPMPANLPISIAGDNLDDKLRLFFVAITRAKSNLYLTAYKNSSKGKESTELQFLSGIRNNLSTQKENEEAKNKGIEKNGNISVQNLNIEILQKILFVNNKNNHLEANEKALLAPLLENYQMSVTHLNNFLNVTRGGPQLFLDQNLLHFPQAKSEAGAFGSAIHATLQNLYRIFQEEGRLISERELLIDFENELKKQRLVENSFNQLLKRGQNALGLYYEKKKKGFDPRHKIEFDFKNEGVIVGGAKLSGKIDKMVEQENEILVCDYKTGKVKMDWKGVSMPEKIQLYNYRRQLLFYKILVENSRSFSGKFQVNKGVLEFVEPKGRQIIDLELQIDEKESERLEKIIAVVFNKIVNLDFPSIDSYSQDLQGILDFEQELLRSV